MFRAPWIFLPAAVISCVISPAAVWLAGHVGAVSLVRRDRARRHSSRQHGRPGLLPWNTSPARMLMGDGGSLFIGAVVLKPH